MGRGCEKNNIFQVMGNGNDALQTQEDFKKYFFSPLASNGYTHHTQI